jgi:putative phosphoribosyl transferase
MQKNVFIHLDDVTLQAILSLPKDAEAIVVFSHGSGSSRHSPRNGYVASILQEAGFATLLVDLMTIEEDEDPMRRFDIPFLSKRLSQVVSWVKKDPFTKHLKIALFGASTGSASALIVASTMPEDIYAVVSRGGRPDMALSSLGKVRCPTLLIVGREDEVVMGLNEEALAHLSCTKEMKSIAGATHLFEEKGALEKVAILARDWFEKYRSSTLQ